MAEAREGKPRRRRELTGRTVLVALLAFFGVVVGVNVVMARLAVSTFGGLETESSYKAGLAFRGEEQAAAAQAARGWKVGIDMTDAGGGDRVFNVRATDSEGRPLTGYFVSARLVHPTDARQDVMLPMVETGGGTYRSDAVTHAGQWDLVVDFSQRDARLFRSKNRIIVR